MSFPTALVALGYLRGVGRRGLLRFAREFERELKSADTEDALRIAQENFKILGLRISPPTVDLLRCVERTHNVINDCYRHGITALSVADAGFPSRLNAIPDPPVLIYLKGSIPPSPNRAVAIVGTREPSDFGRKCAKRIAYALSKEGTIIVSGLALGVDTAAHEGCVHARGRTVAVLAHGLDRIYPSSNKGLVDEILQTGGCLLSEYPPGTRPFPSNFVERDRLQIGMSEALIVIETDVTGGTMHTVRFCREQGKPLGCILHPAKYAGHPKSRGNQLLIAEGKACALANGDDVARFVDAPVFVSQGIRPSTHSELTFDFESDEQS